MKRETTANSSGDRARWPVRANDNVVGYFIGTTGLAWLLWIVGAAAAPREPFAVRALFFIPGTFAPAIVAIALAARASGGVGVRDLMSGAFHWQVAGRWYVFAFGFMAAVKLLAATTRRLTEGVWPVFGSTNPILLVAAVLMSTPFQAGEEIGWRGYALPRLADRMGLGSSSVLLGVIWAAWHLPLFYIQGTDLTGQPFPVFLVSVTAISVAMAWLYACTGGSLLLVMLMHSAINNTTGIVPAGMPGTVDPLTLTSTHVGWFTAGILWMAACYFLLKLPRWESVRRVPESPQRS